MATEDWIATSMIYDDRNIHSIHDNRGRLLRGSIEIVIDLKNIICSRQVVVDKKDGRYRFWTVQEKDLILQVVFWCYPNKDIIINLQTPEDDVKEDLYHRVDIKILSTTKYPNSFPCKNIWIDWLHKQTNDMIKIEQISFSIIDFIEHQCFNYYNNVYQKDDTCLIVFDDIDRTFYDCHSIILDPRRPFPFQRCFTNGTNIMIYDRQRIHDNECRLFPLIDSWKSWLSRNCPICFDNITNDYNATYLPCGHEFCHVCMKQYFEMKVNEIQQKCNNPFICPITTCRYNLPIIKFVKPYLSLDNMIKVRNWYKDIKNPPCYSLPECLRRGKCTGRLRKDTIDSYLIHCEICKTRWCELCIKRIKKDDVHTDKDCEIALCIQFCQRYLASNEETKIRCEEKWPFIKLYAHSQLHDLTAVQWITSNGQVCPGCKTGVERSEGCFHMNCNNCDTHFCYECGEQLFPPYYGTHHCWER